MLRPALQAVMTVVGVILNFVLACAQQTPDSEREAMFERYLQLASYVEGGSVQAHWMADGSSLWYAEGAPENTTIYKVDPRANTKTPLFDTRRLRRALTDVIAQDPPYQGLPFADFMFVEGEEAVRFDVEDSRFVLKLDTYELKPAHVRFAEEENRLAPQVVRTRVGIPFPITEVLSPDGAWCAGVDDHNLYVRSTDRRMQLTTDGVKEHEWDPEWQSPWLVWSPDSLKLAITKTDYREVATIPIVHWLTRALDVEEVYYPTAGGPYPRIELYIVDIQSGQRIGVKGTARPEHRIDMIGWKGDSSEFFFLRSDWYGKHVELMAADAVTGATRVILTEETQTYVSPWMLAGLVRFLADGEHVIWLSERDGWRHLYLYNLNGTLTRRLTQGHFPVQRVVSVDDKAGWVYFTAQADPDRIYDTHLYRVNLEGGEVMQLTQATGQHAIQFAPSKEVFLDTHSSVDRPPVVELRKADGTLLQTVSTANVDALSELRWIPPERFVVKAADGKTDLYGVLHKPFDFDPSKKYPVIQQISGHPFISAVQRTFIPAPMNWHALAQLGFIVLSVDARGTAGRGKHFADVVYGNIGRYEIPDHVAALRQLAAERSYMDLRRVGIIGGSYNGYLALRAMLVAPEVYHVGVASAAISDMAEHRGNWIHLGPPDEKREAYEYASNLRLAGNLKGKLLMVHGTSDRLVPFSHTMKMVEAFNRAARPYDLVVLPDLGHFDMEVYTGRHIYRYFQEHLKP